MKIFYFNITYTCNSNCVFCYSHNTIHSGCKYNEIVPDEVLEYLRLNNIQRSDRVIINGGEPFLHSNIITILKSLFSIGCEVLIYTNGRCLYDFDFSFMSDNYRFVIPIHGHKELHDSITRSKGSFEATALGLKKICSYKCKVDIKIILNPQMVKSQVEFDKTLQEIDDLSFNYAVHITKMADTIISKKNGLPSVSNELASKYTKILYEHFARKKYIIKIFDTCVKDIDVPEFENRDIPLKVYFKDANKAWLFNFYTPKNNCSYNCPNKEFCQSAVGNYTVLEYKDKFYKGIE